jgi:hypothetical protein
VRQSLSLGAVIGLAVLACTTTHTEYIDVPDDPKGTDAGFDSQVSLDSGLGLLSFRPSTLYSGVDGVHVFQVPIAVYDSGDDLVVTASDPTTADLVPKKLTDPIKDGAADTGKYYFVSVKRAGTVTLQATSNGKTVTAKITVTQYDSGRWTTGQTRYMTSEGSSPACTQCHTGTNAVDHSPAAIATATDEKVGATITTGIDPFGTAIMINGAPSHKWTVTDAERDGLVTYLRALEPKGFQ